MTNPFKPSWKKLLITTILYVATRPLAKKLKNKQ